MIVDALTHVTPDGRWFNTGLDASESTLLRQLDAAGVERAVVAALADYVSNEFVLDVCNRYPERLVPGASFNPAACATPEAAAAALRQMLLGSPYRLLRLHPRFNRYDPLDPRCLAVLEELASWEAPMPVWLDSLFYFSGGLLRKSVVDTIHHIVSTFPRLTFVLSHAAGSWVLQVSDAIRDCPNAFLDLSFTLNRYHGSSVSTDLRHLLSRFDRRMLFGSDFPEVSIQTSLERFRELAAGLPDDKCANVLGVNARQILGGTAR